MSTKIKSAFRNHISKKQFTEALTLLKVSIKKAEVFDPRDDYSWGPESDELGYAILAEEGHQAFIQYWEDLIEFFQEQLEPQWGHLHKGHLYFRLGLGSFALDVAKAKSNILAALKEDQIVAESFSRTMRLSREKLLRRFPSYVTLAMLERFDARAFSSKEDESAFYRGLAPIRFDVIWDKKEVEPSLARYALGRVVPKAGVEIAGLLHKELALSCAQQQSYSPISLVASLADVILWSLLRYRYRLTELNGKSIDLLERIELFQGALQQGIFPSDVVRSTFQMVVMLEKALLHGGDKTYEYEVLAETAYLIGYALKILLDRALVEWSKEGKG